jgi:hypothetical protein
VAHARPGRAAADDGHADLDALVLGVELALDELAPRVHGRREGGGHHAVAVADRP